MEIAVHPRWASRKHDLLFRNLAQIERRVNRTAPSKERGLGDPRSGAWLLHRRCLSPTGLCQRKHPGNFARSLQQLSFERIFVRILPSNRESFGLVKKFGFREEGVPRKAFRGGYGELHDLHFLAVVREEWLPAAERG